MLDPLLTGILLGVLALVIVVGIYLAYSSSSQFEDDEVDADPELRGGRSKDAEYVEDDDRR